MRDVIDDTDRALNVLVFKQLLRLARHTLFNTWNSQRQDILLILLHMNSSGTSKTKSYVMFPSRRERGKKKNQCTPGRMGWKHDSTYAIDFFNTSRRHEKLIKLFSVGAAFHHHVQFFSPGSLASAWTTTLTARKRSRPQVIRKAVAFMHVDMEHFHTRCSVWNIPQRYICTLHPSCLHGEGQKKNPRPRFINIPAIFFFPHHLSV